MAKNTLTQVFDEAADFLRKIASVGMNLLSGIFDAVTGKALEKDLQKRQLVDHFANHFMADQAIQENNQGLASFLFKTNVFTLE